MALFPTPISRRTIRFFGPFPHVERPEWRVETRDCGVKGSTGKESSSIHRDSETFPEVPEAIHFPHSFPEKRKRDNLPLPAKKLFPHRFTQSTRLKRRIQIRSGVYCSVFFENVPSGQMFDAVGQYMPVVGVKVSPWFHIVSALYNCNVAASTQRGWSRPEFGRSEMDMLKRLLKRTDFGHEGRYKSRTDRGIVPRLPGYINE